jgi:hypothetical protein
MRCKRFKPGARREEEEYPHGSSTDEQHGSSLKDLQPFGLSYGGPLAARFRSVRRDNGSIAISGSVSAQPISTRDRWARGPAPSRSTILRRTSGFIKPCC